MNKSCYSKIDMDTNRKDSYILLIEDEPIVQENNAKLLKRRGYSVRLAYSLSQAWEIIKSEPLPRAIVLDIMLPDGSGLDFLEDLREISNVPVLLLTSLSTRNDILIGLKSGGDTYLTKPYDTMVFLNHLEALLRRSEQVPAALFCGSLKLEPTSARAFVNGEDMLLSYKEFSLLMLFVQFPDKNLSADFLINKIWGYEGSNDTQTLRKAISRLRHKLEASEFTVTSTRFEGYMFEEK
jgi:DNA-binding response OmpR family regulator